MVNSTGLYNKLIFKQTDYEYFSSYSMGSRSPVRVDLRINGAYVLFDPVLNQTAIKITPLGIDHYDVSRFHRHWFYLDQDRCGGWKLDRS